MVWSATPEVHRGVQILTLTGELDLAVVDELGRVLDEALARAGHGLVVDLIGVSFCDSSCLHALLRTARRAHSEGLGFGLVAVSPAIVRPVTVLNLTQALPISASINDAVARVRRG
ncbi:STAS domain-containing protein [Amycolatopsis sp. 195334CR]|uniref:STAS domain-containing protein n=1 Tax=Amycolatopsis sp. 195334CR TaxID=2814588 RepID=UPI001A90BA3C|nr:STAS domain-containing protein [Amycolatopsis sp. 195334CR]MBN6042058.1 STAS domain-containing protein [Amycolatopsis sp. 195334CR]